MDDDFYYKNETHKHENDFQIYVKIKILNSKRLLLTIMKLK